MPRKLYIIDGQGHIYAAYYAQMSRRLTSPTAEPTKHKNPSFLDALATAYAAAGRFPDAVATDGKALDLTPSSSKKLPERIQNRLCMYKAGRRYIEHSAEVSSEVNG
jgi:hypothetical protein